MSFGKKGLAPGQATPAAAGGFGRAGAPAAQPPSQLDDIAAKREAFIAAERARKPVEIGEGSLPSADTLDSLRNSSRPAANFAARPAERIGGGPVGDTGLPVHQEEQIRSAARGMAGGYTPPPPGSGGYSGGSVSGKKFFFGDPAGRSLGIAYLIWFVIGQTSMHRVYCGEKDSAIIQFGLLIGSFVTLFIFPPIGAIGLVAWMCWLIGDLFMMPGLLRRFKEKHTYDAGVFS